MAWQTVVAQDLINDARACIGEYNVGGVPISSDTEYMKTLQTDGIRFVNQGLREVYKDAKYYKSFEISNKRIKNLLGDLSQFGKVDFTGEDKVYPENKIFDERF